MKKIVTLSFLAAALLNASGFAINEQSSDSVALSNSNVAKSFGADAAYYNPANMVFLDDRFSIENSFSYLQLNPLGFKESGTNRNFKSQTSRVFVPTFHAVSPAFGDNWRFGLSITAPAGMIIRWDHDPAAAAARKFQLKVIELNPTVAYKFSDEFSAAFGLRMVYTTGHVINTGKFAAGTHSREFDGDSIDFGYNIALAYKPTENLDLAATYRSKVNLKLKGDTKINVTLPVPFLNLNYDGPININAPVPAMLNLAAAYTWQDTTFMFSYQRTFWSAWKEMDFDYAGAGARENANPVFRQGYNDPIARNWRDSNSYRFGIAHNANENLRLMAGFMIDRHTSMSNKTGFEVPDTNAYLYSVGANYKITSDLELACGFLYQDRQKRSVSGSNGKDANGELDRTSAYIVNLGVKYKF